MATTDHLGVGGVAVGGNAGVRFTHGSGQVGADVVVEWDLDGDGDFDEDVEDVTGDVLSWETVIGRDYASQLLGRSSPGRLTLLLDDTDGTYSTFNTDSPANTAPFSLRPGRTIRVRAAEAVADDPVLLARDRFDRQNGSLGETETGQTWTSGSDGDWLIRDGVAAMDPDVTAEDVRAVVDVGETDVYVQVAIRQVLAEAGQIGAIVRWVDETEYASVFIWTGSAAVPAAIYLREVIGGVESTLALYQITPWEGMTIGIGAVGSTLTAYVGGAPVSTASTSATTGTGVGLVGVHNPYTGRSREIAEFTVWDHVAGEVDGIIWTGHVTRVSPAVTAGPHKVCKVVADGPLARAARTDVAAPRLATGGAPTGTLIGDVMARAGLLHPPASIGVGATTTGPVGTKDSSALRLAQAIEATEIGFLHETNEGHIGFQGRGDRAGLPVTATWSDDTDDQFHYVEIEPLDHERNIVNRVVAGVAPDPPSLPTWTFQAGSGTIDITIPTVNAGDLLFIVVASSVDDGHDWRGNLWWVSHIDPGDELGMRLFSHWCTGDESGDTLRLYTNSGASPGLWMAGIAVIEDWHLSYNQGIEVGAVREGHEANPIKHGWGREPTLFMILQSGIGSTDGGAYDSEFNPPDGYGEITGNRTSSGVTQYDAGLAMASKIDISEAEAPTVFAGLASFDDLTETVVVAVRGYNGPHTKATLEDPRTTGGDGRFVTSTNAESVEEIGPREHPEPSTLLATEAEAEQYGAAIVEQYGTPRPVVRITFPAIKNDAYRQQALLRRTGHRVVLRGVSRAGLGIDGEFFIESVRHEGGRGDRLWMVSWELSSA